MISKTQFLREETIKRKVQKYFSALGKDSLGKQEAEAFFRPVFVHNIEHDNYPAKPIQDGSKAFTWFKTEYAIVSYNFLTLPLGGGVVYVGENGEWKSSLFFGSENSEGWKEVSVWLKGDLRYKDIIGFDSRQTKYNEYYAHIYTYFQYGGSPFYTIHYELGRDAPEGLVLDPKKQILKRVGRGVVVVHNFLLRRTPVAAARVFT